MDNIEMIKGWLKLALLDWRAIEVLSPQEHKGVIIYHAQQFVEKLCKAIISSLGFEPPKTHNPSQIIDDLISSVKLGELKLNLEKKVMSIFEHIVSLARTLEDEKTRPRYGIRYLDKIIPPDEFYSIDQVKNPFK